MESAFIKDFMSKIPHTIDTSSPIKEAQAIMKAHDLRHLPIVEGSKVVGVLSERDLQKVPPEDDENTVKAIMIKNPYSVKKGTPLSKVTQTMSEKKYGCTIVHDGHGGIVGIFTTTDALRILSLLLRNPTFVQKFNLVDDIIDYERIAAFAG